MGMTGGSKVGAGIGFDTAPGIALPWTASEPRPRAMARGLPGWICAARCAAPHRSR